LPDEPVRVGSYARGKADVAARGVYRSDARSACRGDRASERR